MWLSRMGLTFLLVMELPHAREHHREPVLVRGRDHLGVVHGAAGLDDRRDAGSCRFVDAVAEREEGVARETGATRVVALLLRLVHREKRGVDPAHLAGADSDRRLTLGEENRVGFHGSHGGPREPQVVPFYPRWLALAGDRPLTFLRRAAEAVAVLRQEAPADPLEIEGLFWFGTRQLHDAQVL